MSGFCSELVNGRPCRLRQLSLPGINRWQAEEKITREEAAWLRAVRPMCYRHAALWLESVHRGAKRRIYGDSYKHQVRNTAPMIAVDAAKRRVGITPSPPGGPPRPNDQQRCTARSKQTGARCKAWSLPGERVCRHHGGCGSRVKRLKPDDPRRKLLAQQSAQRALARAKRWAAKQARSVDMLPAHVGFAPDKSRPEAPLHNAFTEHHRRKR
jgi:hypothetical protein